MLRQMGVWVGKHARRLWWAAEPTPRGGSRSVRPGDTPRRTRDARYPVGVILVILAALSLSSGGVLIRHIDGADGWQILFYRSFTGALTISAFLLLRYRSNLFAAFHRVGRAGLLSAFLLGAAFACFVWAVVLTSVANVALIGSTSPLFAAGLAWLVLGERVGEMAPGVGVGAGAEGGEVAVDGGVVLHSAAADDDTAGKGQLLQAEVYKGPAGQRGERGGTAHHLLGIAMREDQPCVGEDLEQRGQV